MESWRDTASEAVQNDLDGLLNSGIELAQTSLTEAGTFVPFAVALTADGETAIGMVEPVDDSPEIDGAKHLEHLIQVMREERDQFRAIAVVVNTRVKSQDSDAISIDLEHVEGPVVGAVLLYAKKRFGRKYNYGPLLGMDGVSRVWA